MVDGSKASLATGLLGIAEADDNEGIVGASLQLVFPRTPIVALPRSASNGPHTGLSHLAALLSCIFQLFETVEDGGVAHSV